MNQQEASLVGLRALERFRNLDYSDLVPLLDRRETVEVHGPSGATYQVEFNLFWDSRPNEVIRVQALVDDGGASAFRPFVEEFLRAPDGSFVGE